MQVEFTENCVRNQKKDSTHPVRQSCLATLAQLRFNTHDPRLWNCTADDNEPEYHGWEVVIQRGVCMAIGAGRSWKH